MEIDYINKDIEDPESSQELSKSAIIGIAVSSAVAGLAIIVAWIAVVMCCCIIRGSNNDRSNLPPQEYKDKRCAGILQSGLPVPDFEGIEAS